MWAGLERTRARLKLLRDSQLDVGACSGQAEGSLTLGHRSRDAASRICLCPVSILSIKVAEDFYLSSDHATAETE